MSPISRLAAIASGAGSQNFLGYRWIGGLLSAMPTAWKRGAALRCLSMSPHYFFRTPANEALNGLLFREAEFKRNSTCRESIVRDLIRHRVRANFTILDFGCGPGFLARAASPFVARVQACDISPGVLACARILNAAPNIDYVQAREDGGIPIPDSSVDLIYSFAVIQHIGEGVFQAVLREWRRVLRPNGTVVCHIVVDGAGWRSERQWRDDKSLRGLLKWRFGMHCFNRTPEQVCSQVVAAGFNPPELTLIRDLEVHFEDDIVSQHLCTFRK